MLVTIKNKAQALRAFLPENLSLPWRIFFIAILIFLSIPNVLYHIPGAGLDPSWQIAIHVALKKGMVFGDDLMFTYGPLGILATRLSLGVSVYTYLVFYLYVLANLAYIFHTVLKKDKSLLSFIVLFFIVLLIQNFYDLDISMFLTCIFAFMIFHYFENPKIYFLANALLLVGLIFLIKVSLGIVTLFIATALLICLVVFKINSLRYVLIVGGCFVIYFIGLCLLFNVNFITYLQGSLHLINGYNDAMFIPQSMREPRLITAILLIALVAVILLSGISSYLRNSIKWFTYGVVALLCYVSFKNGFVRDHSQTFFATMPLALGLLYLFSEGKIRTGSRYALLLSVISGYFTIGGLGTIFEIGLPARKTGYLWNYKEQLQTYKQDSINHNLKLSAKMPDEILRTIGKGTVDIIPGEISYLFYNDLDYNPRPIMQSYSVYDEYLDTKNANKYRSASAPEYILFQLYSFENRNATYEETGTKLAILENYEAINSSWNHLLLKRLKTPVPNKVIRTSNGSQTLGGLIDIEKTQHLQILKADIDYSFLGKIKRFLLEPEPLLVDVVLEDGYTSRHRVSPSVLRGGVIINRHLPIPDDLNDLELFVNSNGVKTSTVRYVKFFTEANWSFQKDFEFAITHLQYDSVKKGPSVGSHIAPPVAKKLAPGKEKIVYNFENNQHSGSSLFISGWAFIDNGNNRNSRKYIVLQSLSSEDYFVFPAKSSYRPDLPTHFGRADVDSAGFSVLISNTFVKPGSYKVGMLIENPVTSALEFSGQYALFQDIKEYSATETLTWEKDSVVHNIESFVDEDLKSKIDGWAFLKNHDNQNLTILLVLENADKVKTLLSLPGNRADLNQAFGRTDLLRSGFSIMVPKTMLPPGTYNVGLLLNTEKKQVFLKTNKQIIKE